MTLLDPLHHSVFCTCLSKKLLSWELLPFCTRKQQSHMNIQSCLLLCLFHSGNEEWETLFYQKTSYSFCQQTGWTLRKSSRILSMHLRLLGRHTYKMFCRQKSSAQAEWILCHLRHAHQTGLLKGSSGEGWSEGSVIQIEMNASTCGKDLTVFEGKNILSPPKLAPAVRLLPSFENYSVQIGNIATLPSCDILFFTKKKKHLQLCELSKIYEITYKLHKYTGLKA